MDSLGSALAALAMGSPFVVILLILVYDYALRVPWRRNRKTRKQRFRISSPSGGLATVVLGLTLIYRPRLHFAIEAQQRQVEDADEDENGEPDSPSKHLHRQLRRIRRGEEVETLSLHLE